MEEATAPEAAATAGWTAGPVVASEVFEARRAARDLREEAEGEARAIRDAARADAEAVRAAARDAGHAAGHAEGMARAAAELVRVAEHRDRALAASRGDLLEAALILAGRILDREVRAGDEVVALAERALGAVRDRARLVLRASPLDAGKLERAGLDRRCGRAVRVAVDARLGPGDVVVETEVGEVDARLATQLAALRRAIAEADR